MEQNADLLSFFFLISSEAKPFPDTTTGEEDAGVLRARALFQWGGSISVITILYKFHKIEETVTPIHSSPKTLSCLFAGEVFYGPSVYISYILLLILTRVKQSSRTKSSLLICCLLASLPTALFNILRGEFGYWVAFISFAAHHFFPHEFPVSGFLLFVVAPSWVAHELHESILGGILCLVIGVSLLINEIRAALLNSNSSDGAWYWVCYSISMLFLIYSTVLYLRFGPW